MNDPYMAKADAQAEKMKAELDVLKAKLKVAAADVAISIKQKVEELEGKLASMRDDE